MPANPVVSIPQADPATDQPGHPQNGASERSRSPSCASTSPQKGGGERRPASRKRNERSPSRPVA